MMNLNDHSQAVAALRSIANGAPRTQEFLIRNDASDFLLTLVLAEGYDDTGSPPAGYQTDTGLTVTGQNVAPGTTQSGLVQPSINVQANLAKCSLHWKRRLPPYDEGDLTLDDQRASLGKSWVRIGWGVGQSRVGPSALPQIFSTSDTMDRTP